MSIITFVEAASNQRLGKTFTPTKTESYPQVKNLNSYEIEADSIQKRFDLMIEHANKGHALFRTRMDAVLEGESRKDRVIADPEMTTLILDVDGMPLDGYSYPKGKIRSHHVEAVCETIIAMLPTQFREVSYIGHASSSFARHRDSSTVAVHIEFILDASATPRTLKNYIEYLNLEMEGFKTKCQLRDTNTSVKYVLDTAMGNPAHLIYIAPPAFIGDMEDPFSTPEDRFCLVEKTYDELPFAGMVIEAKLGQNKTRKQKVVDAARREEGMTVYRPRFRQYQTSDGNKVKVVTNPDTIDLEFLEFDSKQEYARFNGAGKENYAYWCHLATPHILRCWNGDDPFEFAQADPDGYRDFMETYADLILAAQEETPVVFRDIQTNTYYSAVVDLEKNTFALDHEGKPYIHPIKSEAIDDFMLERGFPIPSPIPSYSLSYNPMDTRVADLRLNGFVNLYSAPKHVHAPDNISDDFKGVTYDPESKENRGGTLLKQLCPTIYKVMWHMSGGTSREFEHFVNWVAACVQLKTMVHTTWIFSGVPGTGKGAFFNYVLAPMVGQANAELVTFRSIEDQFNSFLAKSLFVGIDEFKLTDSKQDQKNYDFLKSLTGNERVTIRKMYKEGESKRTYANYMFFSNHQDVMRIEEGDRRFNVGFPQQKKLLAVHPELNDHMKEKLGSEVSRFFSFLVHFRFNDHAARTCLENEAKQAMRVASMGAHQKFCYALRTGDLDYFIDGIQSLGNVSPEVYSLRATGDKMVKQWIKDSCDDVATNITKAEAMAMYHLLHPDTNPTPQKFSNMLTRNDVPTHRIQIEGRRESYIQVRFKLVDFSPADFNVEATITPSTTRVTDIKTGTEGGILWDKNSATGIPQFDPNKDTRH